MHGIIRINAELDGEVIRKADVEIGYLHRAFEKDCEVGGYNNAIPYTDRLNYVSPLINNFAYASAVEKLLGIDVTERCKFIRTAMSEISRVCDHLTCVGASAMELGAFTVFLYMIKAREYLWEPVEDVTGAGRPSPTAGWAASAISRGFAAKVARPSRRARSSTRSTGCSPATHPHGPHGGRRPPREETPATPSPGRCCASAGLRRAPRAPHWAYDRVEFEVRQKDGDNYARYLVRMAEMEQSMRIAEQALAQMPGGPINVDFEGRRSTPAPTWTRASRARPRACCWCPSACRRICRARTARPCTPSTPPTSA
jgi:NADH-quinone oxidoreductase subunit D